MRTIASWIRKAGALPIQWDQIGVFRLGTHPLPKLIELAHTNDGGVFIFAADDAARVKGKSVHVTRDSVLIEYGLFAGVIGSECAIPCLLADPRIPADLLGVTTADLSPRHIKRAREQIEDWLGLLQKRPVAAPPTTSLIAAAPDDVRQAYELLVPDKPHSPKSRQRDPVARATARGLYRKLISSPNKARILENDTNVHVNASGDIDVRMKIRIAGGAQPLFAYPFTVGGDVDAEWSEVALRVRIAQTNIQCWSTITEDAPNQKGLLVLFDPPIEVGDECSIEFAWRWPAALGKLSQHRIDHWDQLLASVQRIPRVQVTFAVDRRIRPLRIVNEGPITGGGLDEAAPPRDGKRRRLYRWLMRDVPGRGEFALRLTPRKP